METFEEEIRSRGFRIIAGLDEAGRGPLAGPVVAAAVVLDGQRDYSEIRDSKVLTPRRREVMAARIRAEALAVGGRRCAAAKERTTGAS